MSIKSFGERLCFAIRSQNYKQKELAAKIGVTETTISRYMTQGRIPPASIIAKFAKELKVTSDYLLGIDDEQKDFLYIVNWLYGNAENLTEKQIETVIKALHSSLKRPDCDAMRVTASDVKRVLEELNFEYEILSPTHIRCFYPCSDDYTMISVVNKNEISMHGKIIGSIDDLKNHLLNIKYFSP